MDLTEAQAKRNLALKADTKVSRRIAEIWYIRSPQTGSGRMALKRGERCRPRVLAEYPDLAKPAPKRPGEGAVGDDEGGVW